MSNRLHNLAKRITSIAGRKIHASEKATLLALADDARDHLGGRSRLTNRQLQAITGLSERAIRMAITALADAGHISREAGDPGAPMTTLVHPGAGSAAPADIAPGGAAIAPPPGNHCRGSYKRENYNHTLPPEDHGTCGRAREPAAPVDEVDQLFDAWDAWLERAQLPGPVTRSPARRMALRARLAEHGLGRLLMAIDQAERGYRAGKFNRAGQGDLWLTFDKVFEVGHAAALGLLARLLDQEFAPPAPKAEPPRAPLPAAHAGESEAVARIRQAARETLGGPTYDAWLAPARLQLAEGALVITAPSHFAADWIGHNIAPKLRRPGLAVRVTAERITA